MAPRKPESWVEEIDNEARRAVLINKEHTFVITYPIGSERAAIREICRYVAEGDSLAMPCEVIELAKKISAYHTKDFLADRGFFSGKQL